MNDTINVLKSRRSVKSFTDQQIADEDLKEILEAATNAPTGMNLQSPKILVIQRKEIIERLGVWNKSFYPETFARKLPKNFDPFYNAPTLLIVLTNKKISTAIEDASLVIGNILNAATSLNIGSCWIHRAREEFDSKQGKELLKVWGLSDDYIGVGHVVLGYPAKDYAPPAKEIKEDFVTYVDNLI